MKNYVCVCVLSKEEGGRYVMKKGGVKHFSEIQTILSLSLSI